MLFNYAHFIEDTCHAVSNSIINNQSEALQKNRQMKLYGIIVIYKDPQAGSEARLLKSCLDLSSFSFFYRKTATASANNIRGI